MSPSDEENGIGGISNRKMLTILLQEIADVRGELKEDIARLDQKLTKKMDALASEFGVLRLEVHQNQATFMQRHDELEQRVALLEV